MKKITLSESEIFVVMIMRAINRIFKLLWGKKAVKTLVISLIVIAFIRYIMFPILEWWGSVVKFLNYVIWG